MRNADAVVAGSAGATGAVTAGATGGATADDLGASKSSSSKRRFSRRRPTTGS